MQHNSLKSYNTLKIDAHADQIISVTDIAQLASIYTQHKHPIVIGEGSNVVFKSAHIKETVLINQLKGIELIDDSRMRVASGECWDDFVDYSLDNGYEGLENLALIPGTVGAAPIQNIGAYGVEVGELIQSVEYYDPQTAQVRIIDQSQCQFGYRDSIFKHQLAHVFITHVNFIFPREYIQKLNYPGIMDELKSMSVALNPPHAKDIARVIRALRKRKLPYPKEVPNAGSFFKNPVIDVTLWQQLKDQHANLPGYDVALQDKIKTSAAWLIEQCGWKGKRQGDAGVYANHALVLVNHGEASGAQIIDLAEQMIASVQQQFGLTLEIEPRVIESFDFKA